jgi:hypothetical protein
VSNAVEYSPGDALRLVLRRQAKLHGTTGESATVAK